MKVFRLMGDILIPELVSEKIDYYIWRDKMDKCNEEYHEDFTIGESHIWGLTFLVFQNSKKRMILTKV